jgi:hypothetical protein
LEEDISFVVTKITANTLSRAGATVQAKEQMPMLNVHFTIFNAGGSYTKHVFHKQIISPSQKC